MDYGQQIPIYGLYYHTSRVPIFLQINTEIYNPPYATIPLFERIHDGCIISTYSYK